MWRLLLVTPAYNRQYKAVRPLQPAYASSRSLTVGIRPFPQLGGYVMVEFHFDIMLTILARRWRGDLIHSMPFVVVVYA